MRKLFATFCAIQSCMALTLTQHEPFFYFDGEMQDLEVAIDVNGKGDALLAFSDSLQIRAVTMNGNVWSSPVSISEDFRLDELIAKIDDEGNAAVFWESFDELFGTKDSQGSWMRPQHLISTLYSPYEVNGKGEVFYLEKPCYCDPVCLMKKSVSGETSCQVLGNASFRASAIHGAIAKNRSGDHLYIWSDAFESNKLAYICEKDGMLSPLHEIQELFFEFDYVWDIKAALSSKKAFCLLGTGWDEWTDYDDTICGALVVDHNAYHCRTLALDDDVDDIALKVDANDVFLVVWEGKEGVTASTLFFDGGIEREDPAPSLFLEKVSIKNGNFYFEPDPQGGFTIVWQQSVFDRENRTVEHFVSACRFDSLARKWTEAERLTPVGTNAFLKGFAAGSDGDRLVVWVDDENLIRLGSLK